MKWREPWLAAVRRRSAWRPLSKGNLKDAAFWTLVMLGVLLLRAWSEERPLELLLARAWIVPLGGCSLALLISLAYWLTPAEIGSGPNGIVRSVQESHLLIPWANIKAYRFHPDGDEPFLELLLLHAGESIRLYLPKKYNVDQIRAELNHFVPQPAQPNAIS